MGKKRDYGRTERFIWKDPRFHDLGPDGKMVFLHLLSSPGAYPVPGLVHATPLLLVEWLNWEAESDGDVVAALQRVQAAIAVCVDAGWAQVDPRAKLVRIPNAVNHEPPDNFNVVRGWLRVLAQDVPPSPLRRAWVLGAYEALVRTFGRDDRRTCALRPIANALRQQAADDLSFPTLSGTTSGTSRGPLGDLEGTTKGSTTDPVDMKAGEITHEKETVTPGVGCDGSLAISINNSNSSNNSRSNVALPTMKHVPEREHEESGGGAGSPPAADRPPARRRRQPSKVHEPPEDFSPRQRAVFEALRSAIFYVPGVGDQTAWDNVADPVRLARELGGAGYPNVDVGLVFRLAAWTQENKRRGKKKIGQFLLGRFSASQERGGQRGVPSGPTPGRPPASGDLEEKMKRTRK